MCARAHVSEADACAVGVEFLNTLDPPNFPTYRLKLKKGMPLMLLRNLDPAQGLCNGTRLLALRLRSNGRLLEARIISGTHRPTAGRRDMGGWCWAARRTHEVAVLWVVEQHLQYALAVSGARLERGLEIGRRLVLGCVLLRHPWPHAIDTPSS